MSHSNHYDPEMGNSKEITTEDGKHKYWRNATPFPLFTWGWFGLHRRYVCVCAREFKTQLEYEVHYQKASYEEKHEHDAKLEFLKGSKI